MSSPARGIVDRPAQRRTVVGDVMSRAVVSAHEGAVVKEIVAAMARNGISTIPVLDDERTVLGVVTSADLLTRLSGDRGTVPRGHRLGAVREHHRKTVARTAAELMTAPAVTVTDVTAIDKAAHLMARARVRCLPVVDEAGTLVGMVSKGDLLKIYLRPDDDIRTEIEQEVIERAMMLNPAAVRVDVEEGMVSLTGRLERRSSIDPLVARVHVVPGVVEVDAHLGFEIDDSEPTAAMAHPLWPGDRPMA